MESSHGKLFPNEKFMLSTIAFNQLLFGIHLSVMSVIIIIIIIIIIIYQLLWIILISCAELEIKK